MEKKILINERDDQYTQIESSKVSTQKGYDFFWDSLEGEVQEVVEKIAYMGGINIKDWGELDLIKEITENIVDKLENRFNIKFPKYIE